MLLPWMKHFLAAKTMNNVEDSRSQFLGNKPINDIAIITDALQSCTIEEIKKIATHAKMLALKNENTPSEKIKKSTHDFLVNLPQIAAHVAKNKDSTGDTTGDTFDKEIFQEAHASLKIETLSEICTEYKNYLEQVIKNQSSFKKIKEPTQEPSIFEDYPPLDLFDSKNALDTPDKFHKMINDPNFCDEKLSHSCQLAVDKYRAIEKMEKTFLIEETNSSKITRFENEFKLQKATIEQNRDTGATTFLKLVASALLMAVATPISAIGIHSLFFTSKGKVKSEQIEKELSDFTKKTTKK